MIVKYETRFHGIFERFLWRDLENSSSIFLFKTKERIYDERYYRERKDGYYILTCKSFSNNVMFPSLEEGCPISITGHYLNKKRDRQSYFDFEITSVEIERETTDDVKSFLSKMVTKQTIQTLSEIGDPVFSLCGYAKREKNEEYSGLTGNITDSERIKTLSVKVMETILSSVCSGTKIPYPHIMKICKKYGIESLEKMRLNPYAICYEMDLPFKTADRIAEKVGFFDDAVRKQTAIDEVLKNEGNLGNTIIPKSHFSAEFKKLTGYGIYSFKTCESYVVMANDIANVSYVRKEFAAAKEIVRISKSRLKLDFSPDLISYAEAKCGISYGEQQKEAFSIILSETGIKALIGGPGTGKTSTIRGILYAYEKKYPDDKIVLCASTGRAAQRMAESTQRKATTIHRILRSKTLATADFIAIDECSMVDTDTFGALLKAIKPGALVLLIGDVNQLEAVGHGKVLQDLLCCHNEVSVAKLTQIYRQKGSSPIVENAAKINDGVANLSVSDLFRVTTTKSEDETLNVVKDLYEKVAEGNPFDTQILCPSRVGDSGVVNTNKVIQDLVNPTGKYVTVGGTKFRYNDKIIMLRNNYEIGYYNGDIGIITGFYKNDVIVAICGEKYVITEDIIDDMALAYSMTIHKSQGSEFKNVIIVLPKNPANMLVRNLTYTAVTRAKVCVWIIEESGALKRSILTVKNERRTTLVASVKKAAA